MFDDNLELWEEYYVIKYGNKYYTGSQHGPGLSFVPTWGSFKDAVKFYELTDPYLVIDQPPKDTKPIFVRRRVTP